jgi:glycosyltransferase involved in cell wall biosynthesis
MKIALVHDYLREYGGAERVLENLHEIWPEAPLYTSFVDWKGLGNNAYRFKDWDIRTSWVQHRPLIKKFISPLRFLAPKIWSSLDLSGFDVVLSSSGWFMCRGVVLNRLGPATRDSRDSLQFDHEISPSYPSSKSSFRSEDSSQDALARVTQTLIQKHQLHICYIHHPPRNLYGYPTGSDLQKYALVRAYAAVVNFYLRHYDFKTAQAVDYFIANSKETARRVEKFYRRESTVIYPPINLSESRKPDSAKATTGKQKAEGRREYFLSVGRLSWAKRVDLIIEACNKLKLPLKVVGCGKEEKYLKSISGPTVEFLGNVSDKDLGNIYIGAKALIFAALEEDFGMVPVEAMAYGTPVIALSQGGVKETVIEGKTGTLFEKPEINEMIEAIEKFNSSYAKHDYITECRKQARNFSQDKFKKEIVKFVAEKYNQFK